MIYVLNYNESFNNQIQYVFSSIFFKLGIEYREINFNGQAMEDIKDINCQDIVIAYIAYSCEEDSLLKCLDKFRNMIIIKQSGQLFNDNYLKGSSIPWEIKNYCDINSIFNDSEDLYIYKNFENKKVIKTNIDIISDIFFMLTRYEEVINKKAYENERHSRFPARESIAFKNNFLHRPIVDEHIDLLWSFIECFNAGYKRKKWWGDKDFAACLTHDVDRIQKYKNINNVIRCSGNLLLKQKKPVKAIDNFFNYYRGYEKDPYYTFGYIMNLEKTYGFKSSFYFMTGGTSEVDNFYDMQDKKVKELIEKIEDAGFEVGYHGSYNSYDNADMLKNEKEKLDGIVDNKPYGCRQHYLRFQAPYTWRNQEKAGLLYDSTLSFAEAEGFRCGTCFPFKPYDLLENRVLDIWEIPLIVMEGSLQDPAYRAYTPKQGLEKTKNLIDVIKAHKGVFTMLYHNSSFDSFDKALDGWRDTYEETMNYLYINNCLGTSGRQIINRFM